MRPLNVILLCCLLAVAIVSNVGRQLADSGQQRHQNSLNPQLGNSSVITGFEWLGGRIAYPPPGPGKMRSSSVRSSSISKRLAIKSTGTLTR